MHKIHLYYSMLSEANVTELQTRGYTVVPGVISPRDCDRYIGQYQHWLTQFCRKWPKSSNSLIRGYNTGHLETTWQVRLQAKQVFAQVWKTDKLLTSFDAIAIGRPPEDGEEPYDDERTSWLHLDQESTRDGLHGYQGGVYLEEAANDDWTLQVMENSHLVFEKFFRQDPRGAAMSAEKQFFRLNPSQLHFFERNGCKTVRVPVPKGGMVLWDSRLVHANASPKKNRENPGRWRYVVFVSMTPARWASPEDMANKQAAFQGVKMTNHWSSDGAKAMNETAASQAYPKKPPACAGTLAVQQLGGAVPYDFNDGKPNGPPKPHTRIPATRQRANEMDRYM